MRFLNYFSAVFILCLVVSGGAYVQAQPRHQSCEKAEHTADVMVCLNQQHDRVQNDLNNIFLDILKTREDRDQDPSLLWEIQKGWLAYRDQECERQAHAVETESLNRIQELKCLVALTEQRIGILGLSFKKDHEEAPAVVLPLWMNVVASERPAVFWNYGERLSVDLNCDGAAEHVMTGLQRREGEDHVFDFTVALAEVPEVGRPVVEFFVYEADTVDESCVSDPSVKIVDYPEAFISEDDPVTPKKKPFLQATQALPPPSEFSCTAALELSDLGCKTRLLYWTGERYKFTLDYIGS